jgi:hypothetical protein
VSWFAKIDANWPSHPKAIKAGSKGRDLYIAGLCYCRRHLTDGFIPREALSTLQPGLKSPSAVATLLVRLHLWEQRTDGFVIHDYLDWNDSAADIKATQEAAKKRKREWWHRHLDAVPNASRNASSTTSSTFPTPNKETAASPRGNPEPKWMTAEEKRAMRQQIADELGLPSDHFMRAGGNPISAPGRT